MNTEERKHILKELKIARQQLQEAPLVGLDIICLGKLFDKIVQLENELKNTTD